MYTSYPKMYTSYPKKVHKLDKIRTCVRRKYTKTGKGKMQTIFYMLYDPLQLLLTIKLSDLIWSISVALYAQKYESCYANTSDCYFPCLTFFIYTMPHSLIVSNSILQLKYTSVAGIKVLFCNFQLFIKTTEVTFHKKV